MYRSMDLIPLPVLPVHVKCGLRDVTSETKWDPPATTQAKTMAYPSDRVPPVQDLPPPGGYPKLNFSRNLPPRRFSGAALFLAAGVMIVYGFSKVISGSVKERERKKEKREVRATVLPFLQAEEDVRYLRQLAKYHEFERIIMRDVEGWEVGKNHYHTTWMPYNPGFGAFRAPVQGRNLGEQ